MSTNWVKNEVANSVVMTVQQSIANGKINNDALHEMMDLISGVKNYDISDLENQGHIRKIFEKERYRHSGSRSGRTASFGIDLGDVVSVFWEHVFKYLPRASQTGDVVSMRVVDGQKQETDTIDQKLTKQGLTFVQRNTKCNPIHYLRDQGIMGVRNLINSSYRRNIMMVCDDCGTSSSVSSSEANEHCPKCNCAKTEKFWPDGNSSYRAKKSRRCLGCGNTWTRQFTRKCYSCGSDGVRTEARVQNGEESMFHVPSSDVSAHETLEQAEIDRSLDELLDRIYKFLPSDPKDPKAISRTKDVFNIMTRPEFSRDMCGKCVKAAPLVCEEKCKDHNCSHSKIPDPNLTCGEESFALNKCVNFSKKIGEYHGCSASLAARRVKKVREYFKRYVQKHKLSDQCQAINAIIRKMDV